ncbi:MAG: cytochrome P450 [Pseudomonadota bacterium]
MTQTANCPFSDLSRSFELSNADLEATYAQMHADAPVSYLPDIGYWAVSDYREIRRILSDQSTFSPEIAMQPFQEICPEAGQLLMEGQVSPTRIMVDNPGDNHRRARQIVQQSFMPSRLKKLEPAIYALVDQAIDGFVDKGEADLIEEMLYELPALVLFKLLGVPGSDVKHIKRWADNRLLFIWGRLGKEEQIAAAKELVDYWQYCTAHVERKAANPGDDMPSFLLGARSEEGETLSRNEIIDIMFGILLAGHETTTNQSANTLQALLENGAAWQALVNHPDSIPNAVEEGLRFRPSVIAWRRKALEDVQVCGVSIPSGANLLLYLAAANRDPGEFEMPADLDVKRSKARAHISFGFGPHFCLGAPLARLEMRIILERLAARLKNLRLQASKPSDPIQTLQFRGPTQLWVTWDR